MTPKGNHKGTTVAEMAAWLRSLPDQDAIVQIFEHTSEGGYYMQGGSVSTVDFDPDQGSYENCTGADHWEYTDFRGNPFVKPEAHYYNQRYLFLGAKE